MSQPNSEINDIKQIINESEANPIGDILNQPDIQDETIVETQENRVNSDDNNQIELNNDNQILVDNQVNELSSEIQSKEKNVILKLGDIIIITDPTNEILNNNIFLIDFIDEHKIKLINSESFAKVTLQLNPDSTIGDGTITGIKIISSNEKEGYAKQNELLPGTWINIYMGGDIPIVVTGEIINLEEDMIELRTTDNDIIYINFNYNGLPEDLPIETIEIRPAPESAKQKMKEQEEEREQEGIELDADELVELGEEEEEQEKAIPTKVVKDKIEKMLFDADDLQFGDIIQVQEYVNIDKDKYRYNVEAQANDLLEEMISTIPNDRRTSNVLNNIHIMITRFLQLRDLASTFDENKNITGVVKKTSDDRPLAEYLSEFKNNLYWIMLVATNVKKVYGKEENKMQEKMDDMFEVDKEPIKDVIKLSTNAGLNEMSEAFQAFKSNIVIEGQNKYASLYSDINKYMTPFENMDQGSQSNVFDSNNGIIIQGNVKTDINAIVDNLGSLYSSVVENSQIVSRRFVIQKYNMGLERLEATNLKAKGSKMIAHRVKLTSDDQLAIKSVITLPEPAVKFSQINLPGTSLLVRSNLNLHFLNYWQLLKQSSNVTQVDIDGLDLDLEYNDSNFVDNIKQYILDLSEYNKPELLSNLDIYKIFLRTIIPKIRVLFMLVKKYIKGKLSMVDVINYLEPYLVYPVDLTYMQYREIDKFIKEKINEYNKTYKEYANSFYTIKNLKRFNRFGHKLDKYERNKQPISKIDEEYIFSNPIFKYLNADQDIIIQEYDVNPNQMKITPSEFLKKIKVEDFGNLYNTAVAFTNIQLMFPKELNELLKTDKERMAEVIQRDKNKLGDKCTTYTIAKKYISKKSLLEDNGKTIYFDKEYDTTNYDIVAEKYAKQRDQLASEDFLLYLTNEFVQKHKLLERDAEELADTLVNQAKKVKEGQYAILTEMGEDRQALELEYYVRNNDEWVLATEIDPSWFIKDDDVLCNIDYNCLYNPGEKSDDKCDPTEVSKDTLLSNALKQVLDQFDKNYDITKEMLTETINKHLKYYTNIFGRLEKIKKTQFYKYNQQKYNLGLSIQEQVQNQVVSPYASLRDLILGQTDFVKKQNDIIRFCTKYTYIGDPNRPSIIDGQMENEWWFYCRKTNVRLIPAFRYYLATAFLSGGIAYQNKLDELIKQIGKQSDDGNAWVDENSGEIISYIEFDVTEGYRDGFVDRSREIMEKDAGEAFLEQKGLVKDKRLTAEGQIVTNIVSTLSHDMGIDIEQSRDFIVKIVTELMNDTNVIEKESAYRKREQEMAKKNKKIPEYVVVYSSTLMYLTLGAYLIGIQTSIPSIKTRKTFPGCVRSFSGYPLEGEGDNSGLNYLACVALKLRNPKTIPWNALPKNEEKIATTIKAFTNKFLLTNGSIEQKIKEKVEYILTNPEPDIPDEHNLTKWTNFLPPLRRFDVKHLENISDGFLDKLQDEFKSGSPRQLANLLVVHSKIISFSMGIQESIQKIIEKKDLLLKSASQPFIDNACCNEPGNEAMTCLQYFSNEDASIQNNNKIVNELSLLLKDIKILTQSASMLSEVNTKRNYPEISNDFSEETIYQGFIHFCKFQSSLPLTEDLATICIDKPDYLRKTDSIQEKIQKLKRDGRSYTKEMFLRLFQLVSRNNIINISLSEHKPSCIEYMRKVLEIFDNTDDPNVPKALTQKLEILVDSYDLSIDKDTDEMRVMKNYLEVSNTNMRKELIDFLKRKSKMSKLELNKVTNFVTNMSTWKYDANPRNVESKISDDGLYNQTNYFKNFVYLITMVFPTMIINQKLQSIQVHKYLKLSQSHQMDVTKMINNFYGPIESFYGNIPIKNVLNEMKRKTRGLFLLSKVTPVLSEIKIGDKSLYSVFDRRIVTLLYEYYVLSVLSEYIAITRDASILNQLLTLNEDANPNDDKSDLFSQDFLVEQQLRFTDTEQEFIQGDVSKLQEDVAKLIGSFLKVMMKIKDTLNVSFEDIEDKVYKLKEAEKYSFTDRLRDMTEEERAVDTILKHHKLGPLYSIGLSKGLREYDPENFDHDKQVAEKVAEIQNKLKRKGVSDADLDFEVDENIEQSQINKEIDDDAYQMNMSDDWDDGDPWGEEQEDREYYD
uniref:Uncharacterized protein n=1 Tax=viral metagenome TaxID=1070528 RepID=A0A6C0IWA1_9ZZZZ